jgi:hypothetical protein
VQLELAQRAYMDESVPDGWNPELARSAGAMIVRLLDCYLALAQGREPAG